MLEGLVFTHIRADDNTAFCILRNPSLSVNIIFALLFSAVVVGNNIADPLKESNELIL